VGGLKWSYRIQNGHAIIESGKKDTPAVSGNFPAKSDLAIPSKLGGRPVTEIGKCAFAGIEMKRVSIPASVTKIGVWAFDECCLLKDFDVDAANPVYRGVDGVLCSKNRKTLVCFPPGRSGHYPIPEGVTRIAPYAFSCCCLLTSVTIPDSMRDIGMDAFLDCGLKTVTVPAGVTNIGAGAFICFGEEEPSLKKVSVASGNRHYASDGGGVLFTKDRKTLVCLPSAWKGAFRVPTGVTRLEEGACNSCEFLTAITLPSTLKSIGGSAFVGCLGLTGIAIPASVRKIGAYAFCDCENLKTVTLPANLAKIEGATFEGCWKLTDIAIPRGVTAIGQSAFRDCRRLKTLELPPKLRAIGNRAFENCSGIESLSIPTGVDSLGKRVFKGCKSLKQLRVPAHWKGTAKLKNASVPSGCKVVYVVSTYTVKFDANGGTGTMAAQSMACGRTVKLRANAFKRTGCTFAGWAKTKTGAVAYKNAAGVKDLRGAGRTITLYARWKATTYKVAFNANGGTGTMAAQSITYGKTANLARNAFRRSGWTFRGWARSRTGKVVYKNAQAVKNLRSDGKTVALYAQWAKTKYTVAYNANGGTGTMAVQSIKYDATATLRANAFTRVGYTFGGWSKSKTGAKAYADKQQVKNLRSDGGTTTLYAVWTENPKAETSSGVPYAWLKENADSILAANGGDYEATAKAKAANGVNTVWECYVAGLNPTDENAAFTAALSFDGDGKPVVSSDPDLGGERTYTVEGVENLGDAWGPTTPATRFFRVKVMLRNGEADAQ
jgi:uncharacterized repeat protein (TIGR02543 family)